MTRPINLTKIRKARIREDRKVQADENAIKFGRSKAERLLDATREKKAADRLSQLKFEDE
ncbi:MAG: DUF4169 family protein [Pseudomonadota bacterium]